jgi:hypothetical protein
VTGFRHPRAGFSTLGDRGPGNPTDFASSEARGRPAVASDGQSSVRLGDVSESYIRILNPVDPGWPSGPVTARIDVYYYPVDALFDCQNAHCAVTADPGYLGTCVELPRPGYAMPCRSPNTVVETTVLTVPLSCPTASSLCN